MPFSVGSDTGDRLVQPGGSDSYADTESDSSDSDASAPVEDDLDGDGYGADDCDDTNPDINPGMYDGCDGVDTDCDGQADDDAIWDENLSSGVVTLGMVDPARETVVTGLLAPMNDKDSIEFYISDGMFGWFYIDVFTLVLPEDIDVELSLYRVDIDTGVLYGPLVERDDAGAGEQEELGYSGTMMVDDSGLYRLDIVATSGSNCETPYEIQIEVGS